MMFLFSDKPHEVDFLNVMVILISSVRIIYNFLISISLSSKDCDSTGFKDLYNEQLINLITVA